jgi:hypothetical protein
VERQLKENGRSMWENEKEWQDEELRYGIN